ncbi:MAG: TPR end-of-group domain-containing protein [Planctomycetota bacterium]|jgi:tetratricopeptide (TPR) repeat protein
MKTLACLCIFAVSVHAQDFLRGNWQDLTWTQSSEERVSERLWIWDRAVSRPVQFVLDYAPIEIDWDLSDLIGEEPPEEGRVWGFGSEAWATLDAFLPLRLGKAEIPSGRFAMALRGHDLDRWELLLFHPASIQAMQLSSKNASEATPVWIIPLEAELLEQPARHLYMKFTDRAEDRCRLEIHLGEARLSVDAQVHFEGINAESNLSQRLNVMGGETDRKALRIACGKNEAGPVSELVLSYNPVAWLKRLPSREEFDRQTRGHSWRLGKNFWTVLESNRNLRSMDGMIPAGTWYLGVHRATDGSFWLSFHDPRDVRHQLIDSFWIDESRAKFHLALEFEEAEALVDPLTLSLNADPETEGKIDLEIAWAGYRLHRSLRIDLTEGEKELETNNSAALLEVAITARRSQDWEQAAIAYQQILEQDPDDAQTMQLMAYCLQKAGRMDEAMAAHERCLQHPSVAHYGAYNIACIHAGRKDYAQAMRWLEKSAELGFTNTAGLLADEDLAGLRAEPDFAEWFEDLQSRIRR